MPYLWPPHTPGPIHPGGGYDFFGFECPQGSNTQVCCQCSTTLTGGTAITDTWCNGGHVQGHCNGPAFTVVGHGMTYYLGAYGRGSCYRVAGTHPSGSRPLPALPPLPRHSSRRPPTSARFPRNLRRAYVCYWVARQRGHWNLHRQRHALHSDGPHDMCHELRGGLQSVGHPNRDMRPDR